MAAQDRRRGRCRRADGRYRQAGCRLVGDLPQVAVVRRAGAHLGLLARGGHAGGGVLSALRLEPDGGHRRPLGAAASSRDRARPRARDGRRDRGLRARADGGVPDPRLGLPRRAHAQRPELRPADRARLRHHHLHPVCRVDDRARSGHRRRDRAILARIHPGPRRARHLLCRPVPRRLRAGTETGRREHRAASGVADVRAVRVRLPVRLRRTVDRRAACRRDRRARALRAETISRKSVLYRRAGGQSGRLHRQAHGAGPRPMKVPRQLALALPHAESFARDDFLVGSSNDAALATIERWPDWADRALALTGPEGAGKSHLAAIWGEKAGARRGSARALGETDLIGSLATGALVLEDTSADLDQRALFHLLNLAREEDGYLLLTAQTAPATWGVALPDLASRLRRQQQI